MFIHSFIQLSVHLFVPIHTHQWGDINKAACALANEVANEGPFALSAGSICQTGNLFRSGKATKEELQQEFREQVDVFQKNNVDFLIAEVINNK